MQQQKLETEPARQGYSTDEYRELVRRAERIRADREGRLSPELLVESAAEVGIQEADLREAERQLQAERREHTQRRSLIRMVSAAVAGVLALFLIFTYNGLNAQRLAVQQARGNLQAALQRRADLVPQVVRAAREGSEKERQFATDLTRAREGLQAKDVDRQMQANVELNQLLASPQFRSSELYRGVMDDIAGSENRINVARQDYNAAATRYNQAAGSFPSNLARPLFGLPAHVATFEARGNVEDPPKY